MQYSNIFVWILYKFYSHTIWKDSVNFWCLSPWKDSKKGHFRTAGNFLNRKPKIKFISLPCPSPAQRSSYTIFFSFWKCNEMSYGGKYYIIYDQFCYARERTITLFILMMLIIRRNKLHICIGTKLSLQLVGVSLAEENILAPYGDFFAQWRLLAWPCKQSIKFTLIHYQGFWLVSICLPV